jgi:2-dehydropantoate 2-reductase
LRDNRLKETQILKIAIIGAGGVGGYFCGRLAHAGSDVTFVARGQQLAALQQHGLEIQSALGNIHVNPVQATADPVSIGLTDVVIFAVKLWDLADAIRAAAPLVGPQTAFIAVQNGVEKDDLLRSAYPNGNVLGGVCYIAAHITSPGVIAHIGRMQRLIFGGNSVHAQPLLGACLAAGIDAEISPAIEKAMWEKFVFLVGLSATTTATRLPIGVVRNHPKTRQLLLEIMQEVVAVGRAKAIDLPDTFASDRLAFYDTLPAEMTASMYKDLERGSRLELDWLSGAVVRLGEALSIPTPANRVIAAVLEPYAVPDRLSI